MAKTAGCEVNKKVNQVESVDRTPTIWILYCFILGFINY